MIISHKHKFIFIKTKKTAGTSIEIALSEICGNEDILTPINLEDELIRHKIANRKAQNYNIPFSKYTLKDWLRFIKKRKRLHFYNHMPASLIQNYVSSSIWNEYYTFCFDRDPIAKSISHYKWRGRKVHYTSFDSYLQSDDVLLIKGDYFYKDKKGNYLVDKVYKMEEMEYSFEHISEIIGLPKGKLKAPSFNTKKSTNLEVPSYEDVLTKYKHKLQDIFKTEYKDLYNK